MHADECWQEPRTSHLPRSLLRRASAALLLATLLLPLASCVRQWKKPGATRADWERDLAECKRRANIIGPLEYQEGFEQCMRYRGWKQE